MPDITRQSVSASQMSSLFNVNPYLTRWMLFRWLKFGEEVPNPEDNRMDWGTRMEPLILQAAAEDLRLEVHPTRQADGSQPYVRNGLIGATRDAVIICPDRGPGALEVKCAFDYRVFMEKWDGGKSPPRHNEIQLQSQMKVGDGKTPYKWGVLGLWCGGEMFYFERKPIPELWDAIDTEAAKMFDDLKNDREPEPFGDPVESDLIKKVFVTVAGKIIDMSDVKAFPGAMKLAEDVRLMEWAAKERLGHDKTEKGIKAKLNAIIKDNETLILPNGITVSAKTADRAGYEVKPSKTRTLKSYVPDGVENLHQF
jgi:hypothetical protein